MTDKYYTPEITEFHVGFEYETSLDGIKWNKRVLTIGRDSLILNDSLHGRCEMKTRVKYLDRQDIESLGFTFIGRSIDIWFEKEGDFDMRSWTAYKCRLQYGLHDQRLRVCVLDGSDEINLFHGTIKNKSELKKILNMINIK